MRIVSGDVCLGHIAHGENVQLLVSSAASGIDREQDRPCDDTSQKTNDNDELEVAHEKVGVDGLVVEDVFVANGAVILDPAEEAIAWWGSGAPARLSA